MNNAKNELLKRFFETFDIPKEKRSDERIHREILKDLEYFANMNILHLAAYIFWFLIKVFYNTFLDFCKCVIIVLFSPFVLFWRAIRNIKRCLKRMFFVLSNKNLILEAKNEIQRP